MEKYYKASNINLIKQKRLANSISRQQSNIISSIHFFKKIYSSILIENSMKSISLFLIFSLIAILLAMILIAIAFQFPIITTTAETITSYKTTTTMITYTKTITILNTFKPYMTAYFSPKSGCEEAIIEWINKANKSIHIAIYSFTLDNISDALILAHSKGIEILVIFEREQISKYSEDIKLKNAGIKVKYDNNPALMHNKIMIVDNKVVLTGSFNWSSQAENKNNENLLIIIDNEIAEIYEKEFQKIWNESSYD